MPAAIVAAATAFAQVGFAQFTLAAFAKAFVTNLVLGGLAQALQKKPDFSSLAGKGQTVTSRQATASHNIIYGRTRVGGTIVHMETTAESNEYLHLVISIAGHEIDGFEKIYFDNQEISLDSNGVGYDGKVMVKYGLGSDTQTAFSDLVSVSAAGWSENHRLRGRACAYVRLQYDSDKFPNGVPNISFLVRGKKVYDPRTGVTAWSTNAALCVNDYLTSTRYGLGCNYSAEIDNAALIAAANTCDESVALAGGGTEKKYECNGVISAGNSPQDIINSLLTSMAGKAVFSGGKWRILAGAYYTPTLTFDEDDLRAGFRVQSLVSRRESFNCIKGLFSSVADNYIPTDFPPIVSDAFIAQDNGEPVYKNIELPFTTSASMAQRLAKIELLKARQQITLTLPLKLHGLQANVGDIVRINNTRMGWSLKPFEVVSMQMSLGETLGVDLELREISIDVFDWSTSEEQIYDPAPNTNLPNPFFVAAPTELAITDVSAVMNDGSLQPQLLVTWTPSVDKFVTSYEVQWLRGAYGDITAETEWNSIIVYEPKYTISSIIPTTEYTIRVRAINSVGVKSAFVSIGNVSNGGDISPPSIPSSLTAVGGFRQIKLTWVNPTQTDLKTIDVYRNTVNNSASAIKIATTTSNAFTDTGLGISETFYYWVRAVDFSGNASEFSIVATATTSFIDDADFENGINNLFVEQGLYAIRDVTSLPASGSFVGEKIYNRTDGKLYQWTGTQWTLVVARVNAPDISGQLATAQIALNAITSDLIAAGSITETKIASDAITSPKILAGAITAGKIAANAVTANEIAAGSVTTLKLAAGAVTANEIAAAAITSDKISANTITGDKIAANTITGGLIAASGIITNSAQINDGLITNAKIANLAVDNSKIANASITTAKIGDAQITNAKIGTAEVDTLKLAGQAVTIPINSYTSGTSASYGSAGETLQTATITSTGAPIFILGSYSYLGDANNNGMRTVIQRDTTVIYDSGVKTTPNSTGALVSVSVQDTPGAGSFTYYLISYARNGLVTANSRSLLLLEVKR